MKKVVLFAFFLIVYSNYVVTQSAKLDSEELAALHKIGEKLGVKGCTPSSGVPHELWCAENSFFICNCSFESNNTCHVTLVSLRFQNLSATLPSDFIKLRYLETMDLDYNYFPGTIPSEWATMTLTDLTLKRNLLSGPFPTALTRMTTLEYLDLSSNSFHGQLPVALAKLTRFTILKISDNNFTGKIPSFISQLTQITTLDLSSNTFHGPLPVALAKLTRLTSLRISDNNFTGKIPNFISQWTEIKTLHISGCSFEGPLPSSISTLTQLSDLEISDLKGTETSIFPSLEGMRGLDSLVLRNCLIHQEIPYYIWFIEDLKTLDLSFNNLTGYIPDNSYIAYIDHIYLTKNNLTGTVPDWVFSSNEDIDISGNHFTWNASSGPKKCDQTTVNFVECYISSSKEKNDIPQCLRKDFPFQCPKPNKRKVYISSTKYEADTENKGSLPYYNAGNWAFSRTGKFRGRGGRNAYTLSNTSNLHITSSTDTLLYTTERGSPISLTYYGLCLMDGNYTVSLHFAEIVFTQYKSFNVMGRRVFDVYVQGELKLKDFDIVKEAGGIGMAVIKSYPVNVKNNTLKIQLYWAGKGTTNAGFLISYGPIISAISVEPNFKLPNFGKKEDIIYPIVVGALFVISVLLILWIRCCNFQKTTNTELRGVDLQAGIFTLKKIERATKNFDPSNKIGEGGFGAGLLSDETLIAVKQLSPTSKQGHREFLNEITLLSALRHPNLVRLYGCCTEGEQSSLILEYMENGCLSRALSDTSTKSKLTWRRRFNICLGIAKGLVYLHEESNNQVVHRDVKCSNVLLDAVTTRFSDANFNAKISDFGLSKLIDDENTQVNTRVVGTAGYMAPEIYISSNATLTPKMDVYSFGIVALNLVTGITCSKFIPTGEYPSLRHKARHYQESQRLLELVDPVLRSSYSSEEAMTVLNVAILCSEDSPSDRPAMSEALRMLCGKVDIPGKVDKLETNGSMDQRPKDWRDNSITRENLSATDSYTESFVTEAVVTELS